MQVALIGASGFVGSALLAEALSRDALHVTAIVRNLDRLPQHDRLSAQSCDIHHTEALAGLLRGMDAVIHAYDPGHQVSSDEVYEQKLVGHRAIITAVKQAGVPRLLCVGGAGSLITPEGVEYIDSTLWDPLFDPYKASILAIRALYYLLQAESELDWVFLAPSVMLRPGARTGQFRRDKNHLLIDAQGHSHISLEDYALAMIDELQQPQHHRERYTVGY
jgi:uncharacterized protein